MSSLPKFVVTPLLSLLLVLSGCANKNTSGTIIPSSSHQFDSININEMRLAREAEERKKKDEEIAQAQAKAQFDGMLDDCRKRFPEKIGKYKKRAECIAEVFAPIPGDPAAPAISLINAHAVATYELVDKKKISASQAKFFITQYNNKIFAELSAIQAQQDAQRAAEHQARIERQEQSQREAQIAQQQLQLQERQAAQQAFAMQQIINSQNLANQSFNNTMIMNNMMNNMRNQYQPVQPIQTYQPTQNPQINCTSRRLFNEINTTCN